VPTYEYACKECGEHHEVHQSFSDAPLSECPSCGGPVRKVFGSIAIAFKGSGFYKTDSRTSSSNGKAKKDSDGSPSESASGSSGSSGSGSSGSGSSGSGSSGSESSGSGSSGSGSSGSSSSEGSSSGSSGSSKSSAAPAPAASSSG